MMRAAFPRDLSLPRFALRRDEAAASLGVGTTKFDEWVAGGKMPKGHKIDGVVLWDVQEVRDCWYRLREGETASNPGDRVIQTRLKSSVFDPDYPGDPRYSVRKAGKPTIRIREPFEAAGCRITPAFMKAYFEALAKLDDAELKASERVPREMTFDWLCDQYYRSGEFERFDPRTQADKRGVLTRFCKTTGLLRYAAFQSDDVERCRDKRSETPGAADKLVKYLRALFKWAISKKLATANPAIGVAKINESEGWRPWTEVEVKQYREYYPVGTKARLALELMVTVGARISDAARIGRPHEIEDWLKFVAHKNRNKKSRKTIECPIREDLARCLSSTPLGDITYLVTEQGRPFTIDGLGNKMRDWCDAAGLPECSAHGLRKAAAIHLAENGATAPELCALFGWSKLETAEIYIRGAQKKTMVSNVFARLDEYRNRKRVSLDKAKKRRRDKSRKKRD